MHRTIRNFRSNTTTGVMLLLGLLCGAAQSAHSTGSGLELSMTLAPSSLHSPAAPPDLIIATTWPDACPPAIERVTMLPGHVDITLRAARLACAATPTPHEWRLNPARAAGWTEFPASLHEVRLYLHDGERAAELIGFQWLDSTGESSLVQPENGFWWPSRIDSTTNVMSGSSITLERQGDRVAVTLLGYERGVPTWYFGSADLRRNSAHLHLVRMHGGADAFEAAADATVVEAGPVLHLHFSSPARAEARIERPLQGSGRAIELQALSLMRLAFLSGRAGDAWRGAWVFVRDGATDARIATFSTARTTDADSFSLADDAGSSALDCRYIDSGDDVVPSTCTLSQEGARLATFDRVGLDRLDGRAADGTSVRLLRIPN